MAKRVRSVPQSATASAPRRPRGPWWRTTLIFIVVLCLAGIVPVILGGEVLGYWRIVRVAPYVVPVAPAMTPRTGLAAPPGLAQRTHPPGCVLALAPCQHVHLVG